jgi:hypothetical protein
MGGLAYSKALSVLSASWGSKVRGHRYLFDRLHTEFFHLVTVESY